MGRNGFLVVVGALASTLQAGTSTIYAPAPYTTINTLSAKTLHQARPIIPAGLDAAAFVLSPNGNTFFAASDVITAISLQSGKILRTYATTYPVWYPLAIAVTPDASRLLIGTCSYSPDGRSCTDSVVEIFNAASGKQLGTVAIPFDQIFGVAVAPDGVTAYVAHFANYFGDLRPAANLTGIPGNSITAINIARAKATVSLPLSGDPGAIAISPDGKTAFVQDVFGDRIFRVALAPLALDATLTLPDPNTILSIALSADGSTLAVCSEDLSYNGQALFLNVATGAFSGPVQAGSFPVGISINSDATAAYLFREDLTAGSPGMLYVLDPKSATLVSSVNVGTIFGLAVSPDGSEVYTLLGSGSATTVTAEGAATPSAILHAAGHVRSLALSPDGGTLYSSSDAGLWATSTATGQVTKKLLVGDTPGATYVSQDGSTIYCVTYIGFSGTGSYALLVVDASSGSIKREVSLPHDISTSGDAIAAAPDGKHLYAMGGGPAIVLDTQTNKIVATISGTGSSGLAVSPAGDVIYISNDKLTAIDAISTANYKVIGSIPFGSLSMAISPDGSRLYAAGYQGNSTGVAVIDTAALTVTNFVAGSFGVDDSGESLAVTPDGSLLYVGGLSFPNYPQPAYEGAVIDTHTLQIVGQFSSGDAAGSPVLIR